MMQNSQNFIMNFIIYMNVFGFINFGKYFVKFFCKTFEGGSDHFELGCVEQVKFKIAYSSEQSFMVQILLISAFHGPLAE